MKHFIGKFIIYILCVYLSAINMGINIILIAALLFNFIFSFAFILMYNYPSKSLTNILSYPIIKYILETLFMVYIITSFFIPIFAYYLPTIVYDIIATTPLTRVKIYKNFKISAYTLLIRYIVYIATCSINNFLVLTILMILAGYIAYINNSYINIYDKYIKFTDNTKEQDLLKAENYRILQENQDAAIYMATLKERNRIAREIHDNVGHLLTRSILQVGAVKAINKEEYLKQPLHQLHETLNTAMLDIRQSIHNIHDDAIDLETAIDDIIKNIQELNIKIDFDMGKQTPKDIKYCFIAIVKEAVTNTLKHSDASDMQIILREHPGFYQLFIKDNGTIYHQQNLNQGMGLDNITNRVHSLNGTIKISQDNGFSIFVSIVKQKTNELT